MEILSITISAKAHQTGNHFSIQKAATALGLPPDAAVALTVWRVSGELLFHGTMNMGSGFELYGVEIKGLKPHEPLIATVSLPAPAKP
jgi:hypothetical protein